MLEPIEVSYLGCKITDVFCIVSLFIQSFLQDIVVHSKPLLPQKQTTNKNNTVLTTYMKVYCIYLDRGIHSSTRNSQRYVSVFGCLKPVRQYLFPDNGGVVIKWHQA